MKGSHRFNPVAAALLAATALFGMTPLRAGSIPVLERQGVGTPPGAAAGQGKSGKGSIPTFADLPALGSNAEARAVNRSGTVIAGHAFDRNGHIHAVKWTEQGGVWSLTDLPLSPDATGAAGRAVNDDGDVAGPDYPGQTTHAVLWPATGGFTRLGCPTDAGPTTSVAAMSAADRIVVGIAAHRPVIWRPGECAESLPTLAQGYFASADAVNGDGTIAGGIAGLPPALPDDASEGVPVRWRNIGGSWVVEQLDSLPGSVAGANAAGDLAGYVYVPCGSANDCQRAAIWFASGGFRQLGTLGGDHSWATGINASGEVVGASTSPRVGNTAYFWSETAGMVQLPFKGRFAAAFAVSDVRPDGTRLVVGVQALRTGAVPTVWVVRTP